MTNIENISELHYSLYEGTYEISVFQLTEVSCICQGANLGMGFRIVI